MPSENNSYWWGKNIQIFPFLLNVVMQKLKKYFNQLSTVDDYVSILNTRGRLADLDLIYYFLFSFPSACLEWLEATWARFSSIVWLKSRLYLAYKQALGGWEGWEGTQASSPSFPSPSRLLSTRNLGVNLPSSEHFYWVRNLVPNGL